MYELNRVKVVKIGGNVIDNPEALSDFIDKFSRLSGPKILVHGGGKEATRMAKGLGLETTMIDGRRVTDASMLDICTMVYAGLVNKRIVAAMQAKGIDAIGFSGADGDLIRATRRPASPVDYGYVGDISPIDVKDSLLSKLLLSGLTPVVCAIMHDGNGQLLNCNADSVASAVAIGISRQAKTDLIFCLISSSLRYLTSSMSFTFSLASCLFIFSMLPRRILSASRASSSPSRSFFASISLI